MTSFETTQPSAPASPDSEALQIGQSVLFEGVSLAARQQLLRDAEHQELGRGTVLLREGEAYGSAYLLLDGVLGIYLDRPDGERVATIEPGEAVGELGLLDKRPASASVVAEERCVVLRLTQETFWTLVNDSHAFAVNLLTLLAERLRSNNATISASALKRRQYERAVMFDALTGIHNRRWLDEMLSRTGQRQEIAPRAFSLALIDIDHFKGFNDNHGHAAGDHVLTAVATLLGQQVRPSDYVARMGGEEFVLLFPNTKLNDAAIAAERLRQAVANLELQMPEGGVLPPVTISIGLAQWQLGQKPEQLLAMADGAMYRAKRSGRNRVELAHPTSQAERTTGGGGRGR